MAARATLALRQIAQGWAGLPRRSGLERLTFIRHPNQSLAHRAGSRACRVRFLASRARDWSLNDDRIPVAHQPGEQSPAAVSFPSGVVGRLLRPQFRVEHERTGDVAASDAIKRPLRLSRRSADGPTAQVRNAVTTTLNHNHKALRRARKREDEEGRDVLQAPGQFRPIGRVPRPRVQRGAATRKLPTRSALAQRSNETKK
jgi:hypothetical protein